VVRATGPDRRSPKCAGDLRSRLSAGSGRPAPNSSGDPRRTRFSGMCPVIGWLGQIPDLHSPGEAVIRRSLCFVRQSCDAPAERAGASVSRPLKYVRNVRARLPRQAVRHGPAPATRRKCAGDLRSRLSAGFRRPAPNSSGNPRRTAFSEKWPVIGWLGQIPDLHSPGEAVIRRSLCFARQSCDAPAERAGHRFLGR